MVISEGVVGNGYVFLDLKLVQVAKIAYNYLVNVKVE